MSTNTLLRDSCLEISNSLRGELGDISNSPQGQFSGRGYSSRTIAGDPSALPSAFVLPHAAQRTEVSPSPGDNAALQPRHTGSAHRPISWASRAVVLAILEDRQPGRRRRLLVANSASPRIGQCPQLSGE